MIMFDIKGWHEPSRKRREAEHEALSTDGFSFLSTKRKHTTLVSNSAQLSTETTVLLVGHSDSSSGDCDFHCETDSAERNEFLLTCE